GEIGQRVGEVRQAVAAAVAVKLAVAGAAEVGGVCLVQVVPVGARRHRVAVRVERAPERPGHGRGRGRQQGERRQGRSQGGGGGGGGGGGRNMAGRLLVRRGRRGGRRRDRGLTEYTRRPRGGGA